MTIQEAIYYGEDYLRDLTNASCPIEEKHINFVKMAIEALKYQEEAKKNKAWREHWAERGY